MSLEPETVSDASQKPRTGGKETRIVNQTMSTSKGKMNLHPECLPKMYPPSGSSPTSSRLPFVYPGHEPLAISELLRMLCYCLGSAKERNKDPSSPEEGNVAADWEPRCV